MSQPHRHSIGAMIAAIAAVVGILVAMLSLSARAGALEQRVTTLESHYQTIQGELAEILKAERDTRDCLKRLEGMHEK